MADLEPVDATDQFPRDLAFKDIDTGSPSPTPSTVPLERWSRPPQAVATTTTGVDRPARRSRYPDRSYLLGVAAVVFVVCIGFAATVVAITCVNRPMPSARLDQHRDVDREESVRAVVHLERQ